MKHLYTAKDSLVFAYAKGSPMLAKYLEMNRVIGVKVWRDVFNGEGPNYPAPAMMTGESTGFPERIENLTRHNRPTLQTARALAYAMADHTGLPLLTEDEQADKTVIHWSDGKQTVSRNLRGLVAEFNRSIVSQVIVNGAAYQFKFEMVRGIVEGICTGEFADAMVLRSWLCQRRNLRGVECVIDGESGKIPF